MTAPPIRSVAATAARKAMRHGMAKSAGGRQARRPVCGTGGYQCDDVKGGAELCALRAGRYAGRGGGSVESRETDDDGDIADSREMSTKTLLGVV